METGSWRLAPPLERRMLVLLLGMAVSACGGTTPGGGDLVWDQSSPEAVGEDSGPEIQLGPPCKSIADCGEKTECMKAMTCWQGHCQIDYEAEGVACGQGCFSGGQCSGSGECLGTELKECPEQDGNLCTLPKCAPETGECMEETIPDNSPPYAESDCWVGATCVGGVQDNTGATPTELALQCDAENATLDPYGCIDKVVCVGGLEGCRQTSKPDATPCWPDQDGDDEVCAGHSCVEGKCKADETLDVSCGQEDYPKECEGGCLECTGLLCHWIPDPSVPGKATTMVRYCRPVAKPGDLCSADPCLLDQICSLGSAADGPIGKETLGKCSGGVAKTKEQCAEQMGKPPLPCILAGVVCGKDGCALDQKVADQWCWPPDWKCFDKSDTYCTHLDGGQGWDSQTGCHTAWVDLDCNDENECTVDSCKANGTQWVCEHQPIEGSACEDGDPCTVGGQCAAGVCTGSVPKCADLDADPCNDSFCAPLTGDCLPPQTDGIGCNDGSACTLSDACQQGNCAPGAPLVCDDGNACNGVETCDPILGCQAGTPLVCDDGNKCNGTETCNPATGCQDGPAPICDDGNKCNGQETCDALQGCLAGLALECDDGNKCNGTETCNPATGCQNGPPPICDDGNKCNGQETCDALQGCLAGLALTCDDGNKCNGTETCNPATGCQNGQAPVCDDGNKCTGIETCDPVQGCVAGTPLVCNDANKCNGTETCNPVSGCLPGEPLVCDDGNKCNGTETCDAKLGCLTGIPLVCSDGDVCNGQETCSPAVGCVLGKPLGCDDGNVCTDDWCNPQTGCKIANNTAPCDDKNASTTDDVCSQGVCAGKPISCDDGNVCTKDAPDPVLGCKHDPVAGPCSDSNVCTDPDTCSGGACVSGPTKTCDDTQFCTTDSCHPVQGCVYTPLKDDTPCPGGLNNYCKSGKCTCVPNCAGKECGDNGCGGICGTCSGGATCVNGKCQTTGYDPSGTYGIAPTASYSCAYGLVSLSVSQLLFSDNGSSLTITPAMNGCCTMLGDTAKDKAFTATCTCPGTCAETYTLTGTFTSDTVFTGTLTFKFTGGAMCFGCTTQTFNVTGTKK